MIELLGCLAGAALVALGCGVAARAIWKLDYPVPQFVAGMAIAIVGLFVIAGQVFWRLIQ